MPWTLGTVLTLFFPLAALSYFVGKRIVWAFDQLTGWKRKKVRIIVAVALVYVNSLPVVYLFAYVVGGRSVVPAFGGDNHLIDLFFSYPYWMALIIVIQLAVVFAVVGVVGFFVILAVPAFRKRWQYQKALFVVGLVLFVSVYSIASVVRDTWSVRVVHRDVKLPDGFDALRGFRIAQIADVQLDGRTTEDALRRYVDGVNSLTPDVVLFAGDLVSAGTSYIDSAATILGNLRSRFGTIAAVGDHDIFSDKAWVLAALRRNAIRVVEDSTIFLRVDSSRIALSAVTYTYPQRPQKAALEKLGADTPGAYRMMLVHQPAEAPVDFAEARRYRLLLAGHTHGGGIAFGIPGLCLLAPASFETKYISGLYHFGEMAISITNGLGLTLAPIRFNAPAEIVLVTLK